MADICEPRVRFELRLQAIQAVVASGYLQPESWQEIAHNQNLVETRLLTLYDAAIVEDTDALLPGEELDPGYQEQRDLQAQAVVDSESFLAATGSGFHSSWVPAG